jgi:UDP-N-acetylglucosamine--N-acetylmuramyl-(pentapeptide) pyrophosphoryl-undecaprenol N-acetylglucosamine transferase
MRVLFTGGGTAGHVIPALPVIRALRREGATVGFVGSRSGLEQDLLRDEDLVYYGISAGKLRRYFSLQNLLDVFRVLRGIGDALLVVRRFRPDVVFSKGGFVSFPLVFAAWLRGIPVVAHESDLTPGLANRLSLPFIRSLCVTFPDTHPEGFKGRVVYTGTPVRDALLQGDADRGRAYLGIAAEEPILLVTGGSLGADAINEVVRAALPELTAHMHVVHVCGPGKLLPQQHNGYSQFEYVRDEWGDLLAAADLVLSRAGANTLYELLALRKANLLVPLTRKASRGDQIENAAYAQAHGWSRVIAEEALSTATLVPQVLEMLEARQEIERSLLTFNPPDAISTLLAQIRQFA